MHYIGCGVGHSMVVCLGGMTMDMRDSAFELSTNASSSDIECQLSSPSADSIDGTNVLVYMGIHLPLNLWKCTNILNIPGMTAGTFHCVPVSGGSNGWALMLFYLTSLVSRWQMAFVETPIPLNVLMSIPLASMMLVFVS